MIFISCSTQGSDVNSSDITKLFARVSSRNQPGDSAITMNYLFLLEQLYQKFFDQFDGPKMKIENDIQNTEQNLQKIITFLDSLED